MNAQTAERHERLAQAVSELDDVDALLVTDAVDLRWTTGFTGTNGLAVVGPAHRWFLTDFRYRTQAEDQVPGAFEREIAPGEMAAALATFLDDRPLRLGFDDASVSVARHRALREAIDDAVHLVPCGGVVRDLRAVKSAEDVAAIRRAALLADEAFEAVVGAGLVGRAERDVALDLEIAMRRRGASGPSFPPIVAAGAHGALPHAEPRDVAIPPGTLVVIDWGARLDGWCSDCTRTVATGDLDPRDRAVYDLVLDAQERALAAVRDGVLGRDVDAVARDRIADAGHGEHFGHGLGHGVGLEVHEAPRLSRTAGDEALEAGHVVTVEPGVYVPGRVGVRIEDLAVVTGEGAEVLSSLPKALRIVA